MFWHDGAYPPYPDMDRYDKVLTDCRRVGDSDREPTSPTRRLHPEHLVVAIHVRVRGIGAVVPERAVVVAVAVVVAMDRLDTVEWPRPDFFRGEPHAHERYGKRGVRPWLQRLAFAESGRQRSEVQRKGIPAG